MDGTHFFYVNPLASDGKQHRQPFFDVACCPTNAVRFIASLPSYMYAVGDEGVFVSTRRGRRKIALGDNAIVLDRRPIIPGTATWS